MILDAHFQIRVFIIQKLLKKLKTHSIAFLMLSKSRLIEDLQAIIGQMYGKVVRIDVVLTTCCP